MTDAAQLQTRIEELSDELEILIARREIKELKARYFRIVDTQDWAAWRELFTDDLKFDFGDGNWQTGGDAFVAAVREQMDGAGGKAISVHRGHMPEIEIDSPTTAHGHWGLADYLQWPNVDGQRAGYRGYGREYEDYRKEDGAWKIASWRLYFIRMDPLRRAPLPDRPIGGPAELTEEHNLDKVQA